MAAPGLTSILHSTAMIFGKEMCVNLYIYIYIIYICIYIYIWYMYIHIYMSYVYTYPAIKLVCKYLFIYIIQISQTQAMGLRSASRFNMGLAPSYWTGRMAGGALLYMLVIYTSIYIYIYTHYCNIYIYIPISSMLGYTCNCGKFGGDPNLQCFQAHGFLDMCTYHQPT